MLVAFVYDCMNIGFLMKYRKDVLVSKINPVYYLKLMKIMLLSKCHHGAFISFLIISWRELKDYFYTIQWIKSLVEKCGAKWCSARKMQVLFSLHLNRQILFENWNSFDIGATY